jgi:hypothetical protein
VIANVLTLVFILALAALAIGLASVAYRPDDGGSRSTHETDDATLTLGA